MPALSLRLPLEGPFALTPFSASDPEALVRLLNDPEIYRRTLRIPFPYTPGLAEEWAARLAEERQAQGVDSVWAIREQEALIGAIGLDGWQPGDRESALGYWLGRPWWNRGIMTMSVRRVCALAGSRLGVERLTADVFTFNTASARVLEKCGFSRAETLRGHYVKDGQALDAWRYIRNAEGGVRKAECR